MHFYKVPRLGSYLAIRLEYQSCLSELSFDAAVIDYLEVQQRQNDQDVEKRSFLEKMQSQEGDADQTIDSGVAPKWDEINPKPFKTQKV